MTPHYRRHEQEMPMINEYVKAAAESRAHELEAAIHCFRECGVEMERFSIEEWPDATRLCVDGVPRFIWRIMYHDLPHPADWPGQQS